MYEVPMHLCMYMYVSISILRMKWEIIKKVHNEPNKNFNLLVNANIINTYEEMSSGWTSIG